ncbi:hypothetical protein E4U12_005534 [Claviceps purpurea]|nr:hypothetical protein E4U12_005534 [Claviceps purpurea]KAG6153691.1 hypothetical protein E4U11_006881 [Claviceps purpurea]
MNRSKPHQTIELFLQNLLRASENLRRSAQSLLAHRPDEIPRGFVYTTAADERDLVIYYIHRHPRKTFNAEIGVLQQFAADWTRGMRFPNFRESSPECFPDEIPRGFVYTTAADGRDLVIYYFHRHPKITFNAEIGVLQQFAADWTRGMRDVKGESPLSEVQPCDYIFVFGQGSHVSNFTPSEPEHICCILPICGSMYDVPET